ncbi:MAG: hypothetical protein GYB41_17035 [Oceanospirillales bacterium]|nr:hypothetical protein [Oceanospirillales bacterium]
MGSYLSLTGRLSLIFSITMLTIWSLGRQAIWRRAGFASEGAYGCNLLDRTQVSV